MKRGKQNELTLTFLYIHAHVYISRLLNVVVFPVGNLKILVTPLCECDCSDTVSIK